MWTYWTMTRAFPRSSTTLPDKVRLILASRGLSLAEISRASTSLGMRNSLHHIPHNFYNALRNPKFSPSLYQLLSLSILSEYRLLDWLTVFGFSLDEIPRLQASFPTERTVELDARVYQPDASILRLYDLKEADLSTPLVPLSRWLAAASTSRRLNSLSHVPNAAYRYVKIGSQDAFAFPELLPGSIVRVDLLDDTPKRLPVGKPPTNKLFLVEHSVGLTCSRVFRPEPEKIVLCSRQLPYASVELKLGAEAVVLGGLDFEIRPLRILEKPVVPTPLGRYWTPAPLVRPAHGAHVGEFIQRARERSGLSFREASERTREIARRLGNSRYYCAPASLSDCETRKLPPRHIHKLISICAVYFASAADLLYASLGDLDKAGTVPMPPEFLNLPIGDIPPVSPPSHFLAKMERHFRHIPYFLHSSLSALFELPEISVRDVFWAGGLREVAHPYLTGVAFLIVDRKWKIPRPALSCPKWAQPIYVLQKRDGSYLCGFCVLQDDTLILRFCSADMPKLLRFRNRVDAEVVGKVVGVVRRLK
jgi:transcriptional regulator with XRE-family HTH domain